MLRSRLLSTSVVLVALTLLQWPPFARSEIIVKDDSSLTALNNSTATYNATTRELHVKGNDAFNVTLAAYEPVLSHLKLGAESKIQIVSTDFLARRRSLQVGGNNGSTASPSTSSWTRNLNEVHEIGSEVEQYLDGPKPKKARKKRADRAIRE